MTKETKILTGLLAGAAIGAGIALILSSDKDGELKDKVTDWVRNLIDHSKDVISNSKDKLTGLAEKAQDKVSDIKIS